MSHAICELIERDATTLWHYSGESAQATRRLDLSSVSDERCRATLDRFEDANVGVLAWETTTDVGIASFLCTVVDRDDRGIRCVPPASGAGAHPRRHIALLRALTEAAQSRLTVIAGARDDLAAICYDERDARARAQRSRELLRPRRGALSFLQAPDVCNETFNEDVAAELRGLAAVGMRQVIVVDLSQPTIGVPVVRVVTPYLEAMSDAEGYVPGRRARAVLEALA
jgi:ribosomal protein S12 methylthiotransferase accessory factor